MQFLLSGLSIVLIDLMLAGDNALIIALAVRSLPERERRLGILGGAGAAVLLRVLLTAAAARLLTTPYLQLLGGVLILWIAAKVIFDVAEKPDGVPSPRRFWAAIWYILVADITMSTDNVLAIAGASHGNFWLILFGLALSIPFVVMSSTFLSKMLDRFPALIYIGSAVLGRVGAEMILNDALVRNAWQPGTAARWAIDVGAAALVIAAGLAICRLRHRRAR
jgi:YjbE family integral membrane protein